MLRISWLAAALSAIFLPITVGGAASSTNAESSKPAKHWPEVLECFQVSSPVLSSKGIVDGTAVLGNGTEDRPSEKSCRGTLMEYSFQNSYGRPFISDYKPPNCTFNRVVVNLTVVSEGVQFDRLAVMYLGDIEVWRTSTAEPKQHPGIHWTYWKDLTTYLSLWQQPQTLIFDLGNIIDDKYNGAFNTTLTATFFEMDVVGPSEEPAKEIWPISAKRSGEAGASAFKYPEENAMVKVSFPNNTVRAVVSVSATGQADEEFWWANVPNAVTKEEGKELGPFPSADSFREVKLLIDGQMAGLAWPFPVVFTGGISPPLHRPLVGVQAFDLLESEIDITPWLGVLCDGKDHEFSLQVVGPNDSEPSSYWLLSGKVFVYVGKKEKKKTSGPPPSVRLTTPDMTGTFNHKIDGGVNYTQSTKRTLEITAPITMQGETLNATWEQRFGMVNIGTLKDHGNYQYIRALYEGESKANTDMYTYFYNGFSYPIESNMDTEERDDVTRLQSDLYQGMDMTITGKTVFSGGIEAFINKLDRRVSGSTLSTKRNSTAVFFQNANGSTSAGDSMSHQLYRFGARRLMDTTGQDFDPYPLLYSRDVEVGNEQRIKDKIYVYRSDYTPPRPDNKVPSPNRVIGDFAPLPKIDEGGGIRMLYGKNVVPHSQSALYEPKTHKGGDKPDSKDDESDEKNENNGKDKERDKGKGKDNGDKSRDDGKDKPKDDSKDNGTDHGKDESKDEGKDNAKGKSDKSKDDDEQDESLNTDESEADTRAKAKSSPVTKPKEILNQLLSQDEVDEIMNDVYEEVRKEVKDELKGSSGESSESSKTDSSSGNGFKYSEEELENMKEEVKEEVIAEVKEDIKQQLKDSMTVDHNKTNKGDVDDKEEDGGHGKADKKAELRVLLRQRLVKHVSNKSAWLML